MDEQIFQQEEDFSAEQNIAPRQSAEPLPKGPVTVVDIHFRNNEKTYFFDPNGLTVAANSHVIIDTSRGLEFGYCSVGNHVVDSSEIVAPLRKVVRLATDADERINAENEQKEKRAFSVCQQKIAERGLEMQLVSAECAFDGSKMIFFFTADGRVDFRELVKDLATVFRTRIELRQIGVRDKAKMVGGLGMCGRPFCCREFLDDFQPVSIKMAKTQSLSLNPTKISGVCGRLMCCLKYEQDAYEDLMRSAPKCESFVDTPNGRGTITEVNLLRQSVKVRMEQNPETITSFKNCDICVLRSGKARKNDPPIPDDLAPLSAASPYTPKQSFEQDEMMPDVVFSGETITGEPVSASAEADHPEEKQHRSRNRRRRGNSDEVKADAEKEDAPTEKPHRRRYRGKRRGGHSPKSEA